MKQLFAFLTFCAFSITSIAQLNITTAQQSGNWADYYVNNVLLGAGVVAFNATFTGADTNINGGGTDSLQIGEFTEVGTNIDLGYGLMLGSGNVLNGSGLNTAQAAGPPGTTDNVSDPDLSALVNNAFNLHNTAILEFDFVPQGDTIRFDYVFASDEYPTYVCSNFNDVFGFFLSGTGINGPFLNGAENLAVVPGTTEPVAINTINDVPGGGSCATPCPCNSSFYVNNQTSANQFVTYNGMTVKLTAEAQVVCGDTYHIKMAIADAGDGFLDSGVFLEGGSFTSNVVEVAIATVNGDSTINEGCGTAEIRFSRSDTSDTSVTPLFFTGTATNGLDMTLIPDSVVLLPGQSDTTIIIDPFNDGLIEGVEFITIEAWTINPCGDTFISSGTLYFYDVPNLNIALTDTVLKCPTDSVELTAVVLGGGPPPYSYSWSTGGTGSTVTVPAIQSNGLDTITISVLDSCALFTLVDTLIYQRNVTRAPQVEVLKDSIVDCPGDSVALAFNQNFGSGQSTFMWQNGDVTSTSTIVVPGPRAYSITMTDSCGRQAVDTAFLDVMAVDILRSSFRDQTLSCPGDTITLKPTVLGGLPDYDYDWSLVNPTYDDSLAIFVQPYNDTLLFFWMRDKCLRTAKDTIRVRITDTDPFEVSIPDREVLCDGIEITIPSTPEGGLEPYSYRWSTQDTNSTIVLTVSLDQSIIVTVTDFCGRTTSAQAAINTPEFPDLGMWLSAGERLCFGEEYTFEAQAFGGAGDYSYEWLPQNAVQKGEVYEKLDSNLFRVVPNQNNLHIVKVTDFCGNVYEDSLRVEVDPCLFIPNVITPNGDGMNDYFQIDNANNFPDAKLFVYNRWGEKVFESDSYKNDWTPTKLNSGVYYYVLSSEFFNDLRGDVTIIND